MKAPAARAALSAAGLLILCAATTAGAQPAAPQEPVDSGAIIMPRDTDGKAVKPAPEKADPGISVPAGQTRRKPETVSRKKRSKEADCKGPAELCRQSKPK